MSDLISRQAAIDCMMRLQREDEEAYGASIPEGFDGDRAAEALMRLPSAQPEIIRCKDCKHKHIENMVWTCPFGLRGGENFFCGYGAEPYKEEQE